MKEISLYIHIPFCKQKCFYCDFPSFAGEEKYRKEYIDALCKEIELKAKGYIINTIFIGGGTPSYLEVNEMEKLFCSIGKLNLNEMLEFTMECNPGTLNREKLITMKNGGINRISFGLQSCNDNMLKNIGRIHSYDEFLANFKLAREIGFHNINVDLMYGLPGLTIECWQDTLNKICELRPEHISAYSLIIEEGTAFYTLYEKDKLQLPSEDDERVMDKITKDVLMNNGYHQYEISNYCLNGKECEHNKVYWKLREYIGVGSSSSSYIDGERISNVISISEYIEKINLGLDAAATKHRNSIEDKIEEFIFMGLRLNQGISLKEFEEKFNRDIYSIYKKAIDKNIERELLIINKGKMALTKKGLDFSNDVMSDFILDKQ